MIVCLFPSGSKDLLNVTKGRTSYVDQSIKTVIKIADPTWGNPLEIYYFLKTLWYI